MPRQFRQPPHRLARLGPIIVLLGCKGLTSRLVSLGLDHGAQSPSASLDAEVEQAGRSSTLFQFHHLARACRDLVLPFVGLEAFGQRNKVALSGLLHWCQRRPFIANCRFGRVNAQVLRLRWVFVDPTLNTRGHRPRTRRQGISRSARPFRSWRLHAPRCAYS
jgi:hypothetical protein